MRAFARRVALEHQLPPAPTGAEVKPVNSFASPFPSPHASAPKVTHSVLDARPACADNGCVKLTLHPLLLATACLPLLLAACGPRSANPRQMTNLHEQNTRLRTEIARLEALIREAGEEEPDLPERIAQREQEVNAATEELCRLTEQETEMKLRALRLQGRLDTFQHNFTQMQKDLTQHKSSTR